MTEEDSLVFRRSVQHKVGSDVKDTILTTLPIRCVSNTKGMYWHIQRPFEKNVFLALCKDNLDHPPFVYTVYLINRSNETLVAKMQTYAFTSDDNDLIQTNVFEKNFELPAEGYTRIENDDIGALILALNFILI
ncbi:hypothetical protein ACFSTF_13800 [Terrilactibacillus laevilacticus]|uniref:Uncharacterized protein n=2 Tax=Terrilactibacillus laevilacticus TaxID=1380157 RepID=A0ABW5PTW7_9BACI